LIHDQFTEPQQGYLCLVHAVHNALGAVYNENFGLKKFNEHAKKINQPASASHVKFTAHGAMDFSILP
jgi:hypothetical protein